VQLGVGARELAPGRMGAAEPDVEKVFNAARPHGALDGAEAAWDAVASRSDIGTADPDLPLPHSYPCRTFLAFKTWITMPLAGRWASVRWGATQSGQSRYRMVDAQPGA
jgi:hypothetical protein